MDQIKPGKERLLLYHHAIQRLEEYERATKDNIPPNDLFQYQNDCLESIDRIILFGTSDPYYTALLLMREELLKQIQKTESERNQITINGITITCINNPDSIPFNPVESTPSAIVEPETKKRKMNTENDRTQKLRSIIENTLVVPQSTGLADVAGMTEVKNVLQETVLFPIQYPQLFKDGWDKWNKVLLYGPPGTGKTHLVHCLAAELNVRLYSVANADLLSSYVGESEQLVKLLFQHCQESGEECLIFIDEIDAFCRSRSNTEADHVRRFKNQLLTELSEMDRNPNNRIFFMGCTNLPWDLDTAFVRRFQQRIYIPLPDRETRLQIFKIRTISADLFNSEEWETLLTRTDGWSGSDITDLVRFAKIQPIRELRTADQWTITENNNFMPFKGSEQFTFKYNIDQLPASRITARPVELNDFFTALRNVKKTVSEDVLRKFEEFNSSFGSAQNGEQNESHISPASLEIK